ncbi:MAG: DUF134 domain-containing protein [Bacteroidota bacterium]
MARPKKSRKIFNPPKMKGFRPFGMQSCKIEAVILKFEEYESIRLVNYEMLPQEVAAKQMNVSRPTFTRIYNKALKQIAISFVEGKAIEIEGGNYKLDKDWYRCRKCYKLIQGIENHFKCENCTAYGENELIKLN